MGAEFTEPERVRLLRVALDSYPSHFGTSLLIALGRDGAIEEGLIEAAAGERAAATKGLLPEEIEVDRLRQLGWTGPVFEAGLVASLALERMLPIQMEVLRELRSMADTPKQRASSWAVERAKEHLRGMIARLHAAAEASEPCLAESCEPEALETLWLWSDDRERVAQDARTWLVSAVGQAAHRSWGESGVDAALRMFEKTLMRSSRSFEDEAARRLYACVSELLACVSLERILQFLRFLSHGAHPQVRRAAVARAHALSRDARADARRVLSAWSHAISPGPVRCVPRRRGALGIFELEAYPPDAPLEVFDDELDWLREAGDEAVIDEGLRLASQGQECSLIRRMIEPGNLERFERAVIDRFEAGTSAVEDLERIADFLLELGTAPAIDALLRGLRSDTAAALASERALCVSDPRTLQRLLEAADDGDAKVALRATRALAARTEAAARPRFEQLVLDEIGLKRWVAIVGLERMGRSSETCQVLRRALDRATPHEEKLILDAVARCAAVPDDLSWTLEIVARSGLEAPLLHCAAWFVTLSDGDPAELPHAWFERMFELLRSDPRRYAVWTLERTAEERIMAELRRRFAGEVQPEKDARSLAILSQQEPAVRRVLAYMMESSGVADRGLKTRAASPRSTIESQKRVVAERPRPRRPRLEQTACFSVLAPECVAPAEAFLVEVFVHSKDARVALASWSSMSQAQRFTAGPRQLDARTTLDVGLALEGIEIVQSTGQVFWDGDLGVLQFPCRMPEDALATTYPGKATFSVEGIFVAETHFLVTVGPVAGERCEVATRQRVIRSAFASYATADRAGVLARIQGMQKVVPFIEIFLDVVSLRSGDRWEEVIRNEIKGRDVLLLFWSTAASNSKYVDCEWRMALEEHGLEGISPVPLESAAVVPPPAELSSLHFNDWTLSVR